MLSRIADNVGHRSALSWLQLTTVIHLCVLCCLWSLESCACHGLESWIFLVKISESWFTMAGNVDWRQRISIKRLTPLWANLQSPFAPVSSGCGSLKMEILRLRTRNAPEGPTSDYSEQIQAVLDEDCHATVALISTHLEVPRDDSSTAGEYGKRYICITDGILMLQLMHTSKKEWMFEVHSCRWMQETISFLHWLLVMRLSILGELADHGEELELRLKNILQQCFGIL